MSVREFPASDAAAFQLAALLGRYEQDVEELAVTWLDADLHARVNHELGEMRVLCAGLPQLSVAWVDLLISHAERMHSLWSASSSARCSPHAERCKSRHLAALRALRQKCLWHFSRAEPALRL